MEEEKVLALDNSEECQWTLINKSAIHTHSYHAGSVCFGHCPYDHWKYLLRRLDNGNYVVRTARGELEYWTAEEVLDYPFGWNGEERYFKGL